MKTTVTQWATKAAGAGAIALLLATPAFAQSRGDWNNRNNTNNDRNGQASSQRNNGNRSNGNNGQANTQRGNQTYGNNAQRSDQRGHGNQTYGNNAQGSYQRDNGNRSSNNNGYRENQRINATGRVSSFNRERDGYRVQLDRGQSFWVPQSTFGNRARDLRVGVSINLGGIFRGGSIYADAVSWPGQYGGYDQGFVRGVVNRVDYRTGTVWLRDDASGRLITADVNGRSLGALRPGEYVELSGQWINGGVFDVASIGIIR
ncbi:MAG TPA: hypothetical protein VGQ21_01655 [Thermoanaerobaculia bacterium]|jgi:hypothetical protein|nr:hypothetical protein [Thermoanaerobaculia bacterium]